MLAVALKATQQSFPEFLDAAFSERALAAYRLSFGAALIAALINGAFGLATAWALVRYEFPGKGVDEEEASVSLGASGLRTFWSVTAPNILL
ncbi:hypothetical protein [Phenylobacterium sp.]|uniref:hypothetical protein n=1 Tax=Phenylobacterium sp. TaxID=1871053 RepID=UPI00351ED6D6